MKEKGVKMQDKRVQGKKTQGNRTQGSKSQGDRRPESRAVKGAKPGQKQRTEHRGEIWKASSETAACSDWGKGKEEH